MWGVWFWWVSQPLVHSAGDLEDEVAASGVGAGLAGGDRLLGVDVHRVHDAPRLAGAPPRLAVGDGGRRLDAASAEGVRGGAGGEARRAVARTWWGKKEGDA
jgi:hypothetical protein